MKYVAYFLIIVALIAGSFIAGRESIEYQNIVAAGDVTSSLSDEEKDLVLYAMPWLRDAVGCWVGDLKVFAPNTENPNMYWVYADNRFVIFDKGSITLGLTKGREATGTNGILMLDKSKNGTFGYISYDYLDSEGNVLGSVTDFGRDGQSDLKMDLTEDGRIEVWVENDWYIYKNMDKQEGVVDNGIWVPIAKHEGKYVRLPTSNQQLNTDSGAGAPPPVN
jgi:hypothetical protein